MTRGELALVGALWALMLLGLCARSEAGERPGWSDADGDCQDTRQEVLIRDSLAAVRLDAKGCRVLEGLWADRYGGKWTTSPRELDVDHVVPLAYAARARRWTRAEWRAFANDPGNLWAVSLRENRRKGDSGPAAYWPPNPHASCAYLRAWLRTAQRWRLDVGPDDSARLAHVQARCERGPGPVVVAP